MRRYDTSKVVPNSGIGVPVPPARLIVPTTRPPTLTERTPAVNSPGLQETSPETIKRLNALATELHAHGWTADIQSKREGPPTLHARNPVRGANALSEHIHARPDTNGTWAYWWPWAELIATAPADAAAIIVRVLRPAEHTITRPLGKDTNHSASSASGAKCQPNASTQQPAGTDFETVLRNAEQFLARTGSLHPDLSATTLLRCLKRYRTHLWTVVHAARRASRPAQPEETRHAW